MGLLDLPIFQTARERPRQAALQAGSSVISTDVLDVVTPDQDKARLHAHRIPFIADVNNTAAMLAALCALRVEFEQSDGTFEPAESPADRDFVAEWSLGQYRPPSGSQAHLVHREMKHRFAPGESWKVQVPDPNDPMAGDPNPEHRTLLSRWMIFDRVAVQRLNRDFYMAKRHPAGTPAQGTAYRVHRDLVQRVWTPDDTWDMFATSPMFGVIDDCDQLRKGYRNTNKRLDSRTVGGKILHFPAEAMVDLPPEQIRPGGPTKQLEKAYLDWANSNASSKADNQVGSIAPLPIWYGDKDSLPPTVIDLGDTLDPQWREYRLDLIQSIAQGLPYPTQLILEGAGAGGNHWGDWLADDKVTQRIKSELGDICESITIGQFRPMLRFLSEQGMWDGDPDRVRVGFDESPLTLDQDMTPTLVELLKDGVIGTKPLFDKLGLTDDDLASEEERARRLEFVARGRVIDTPQGIAAPSGGRTAPPEPSKVAALAPVRERIMAAPVIDAAAARMIADALRPTPMPGAMGGGGGPVGWGPAPDSTLLRNVVSAAPTKARVDWSRFTSEMQAEDHRFRDSITVLAAASMKEALRRAGVALEGRARNKSAAIKDMVRAAAVSGWYPPPVLAAVGIAEHDLLGRSFDTMAATAVTALAAHQARRRKIVARFLPETDFDRWEEPEQDRQRALGAWLPAAMLSAAVARLTTADVAGARGEVPVDRSLPGDVVASALRVSNGAQVRDGAVEAPTQGAPVGLADPLVLETTAAVGVLPLYQWMPGDSDRPFEPHTALEGVTFDDDSAPDVLANSEDWPPFDQYFPGDHSGCLHSIEVVWQEGMAGDFGPGEIAGEGDAA